MARRSSLTCLLALAALLAAGHYPLVSAQRGSRRALLQADDAAETDCPLGPLGYPYWGTAEQEGKCCRTPDNQGCAALVVDGEALPLSGAPGLGPVEPPALAPSLPPEAAPGPSPALPPPEELPQLPPSPAPAPVEEVPAVGASPAPAPLPAPASPPPASPLLPAARSPEQAPVAEVPSPPPSPPVCEPLPSTEVTVPDVTLKWVGDFSQGMNSFAPDFGGDLERLLEQNITVLGPDPTAAPGATRTGVLMVVYAANETGPDSGAVFFVYPFGASPLGDAVRLQYKVMFENGFDWASGGTLPGLFQGPVGSTDDQACFGSFQPGDEGVECFAIRPLWRTNGAVELSMYIPKDLQPCQLWEQDGVKGRDNDNVGVGLINRRFRMQTLVWYTFDLFVKLNTPGQADGQVVLSANGRPLASFPSLVIRTSASQSVDSVSFASYFLGAPETAPKTEQHVLFKDFRVFTKAQPAGEVPAVALPAAPGPA